MKEKEYKHIELKALAELEEYRNEIHDNLKGLVNVPWFSWTHPLNLLKRRRESYLLGELRAAIVLIDCLKRHLR